MARMLQCTLVRYVRYCIAVIFQFDGCIVLESDNFRYSQFAAIIDIETVPHKFFEPVNVSLVQS